MTNQCDNGGENLVPIKYLHRRDDGKSSNYYVRLVAPTDIQGLLSKKDRVYRQSTGTADIRIANVRGAEMVARKLKEWQALRMLASSDHDAVRANLTPTLIEQISGARLQSWLFTDDDARDIFERFDFYTQIERLAKAGLLYLVVEKFANIELHPDVVDNADMGLVFEELIRKFAEISNETAGEHFTRLTSSRSS